MASFKPAAEARSSTPHADAQFLRWKIIELSRQMSNLAPSMGELGSLVVASKDSAVTKADYERLMLSLEALARSFETLHRYGDFGDGAEAQKGRLPS